MKNKKILVLTLVFLLVCSLNVFASRKPEHNMIFMGEIEELQKNEEHSTLNIKVKGYVKGFNISSQELIAIVDNETLILPNECPKEGEEIEIKKVDPKTFTAEKGDVIFLVLSEDMTKSIPPQVSVKAIQIADKK
ncbi:hypothetical protein [Clostridium sp.]|jgi:hypothetical protein|uniref:hypothetical protein n=1 Tax=Clostridium sp. TaxID=1506 RepID=UPI0025C0F369|nr:hypothetical protein [Clostridium sp.]MCI9070107.1 hypothetical protein [Clostridium sp.]